MSFNTSFERFDRPFPIGNSFPSPQNIGHFSVDGTGHLSLDKSQMRYLKKPAFRSVRFDLNQGYKDISEEPETKKGNIDYIAKWIKEDRGRSLVDAEFRGAFVCRRHLLTTLISTPYESNAGWKMAVMVHKGNFYMCQVDYCFQLAPNASKDIWLKASFWGWKIEQFLTADSPDGNPTPHRTCNPMEEFNIVNKLKTQSHMIVYNCEMDAFNSEDSTYVEVKTSKLITDPRQEKNLTRFKLQKWWAQSQLGGVSGVLCGYRDDNGIVTSLEFMPTASLPQRGRMWKDKVCYHFLDEFLSWMKQVIGNRADFATDNTVHVFEFSPQSNQIRYSPSSDGQYRFLPDWYTKG